MRQWAAAGPWDLEFSEIQGLQDLGPWLVVALEDLDLSEAPR